MVRRSLTFTAGCGLLFSGCSADGSADATTECVDAQDVLAECGHDPIESLEACDGEAQQAAAELNEAYDAAGCGGVGDGKSDSVLCRIFPSLCDEPLEPLWPAPSDATTRFPILLAHGFNTSTTNFWRFNDVDVLLRDHGHGGGHVGLGSVPPFDTPEIRATFLAQNVADLLEESGADKVNLLCFSMGGLDCRHLVSPTGAMTCADSDDDGELDVPCEDVVASVVTISSPNHGSGIADGATGILPDADRSDAIDFVATLWGKTFSEVAEDSHLVAALESMTEARFEGLHDDDVDHVYPKNPKIYYQSWAGFSHVAGLPNPISSDEEACTVEVDPDAPSEFKDVRECDDGRCTELRMYRHDDERDKMDALLVGGAAFVAHGLDATPNDGVSTVESSIFGEFMGCYPADHLDQVGQINDEGTDPDTGFNYQRLYLYIAEDLATERTRKLVGPVDEATGRYTTVFERASF